MESCPVEQKPIVIMANAAIILALLCCFEIKDELFFEVHVIPVNHTK